MTAILTGEQHRGLLARRAGRGQGWPSHRNATRMHHLSAWARGLAGAGLVGRIVVAGGDGDDEIETGQNEQPLAAIAEKRTPPSLRPRLSGLRGKRELPRRTSDSRSGAAHRHLPRVSCTAPAIRQAPRGGPSQTPPPRSRPADAREVARHHAKAEAADGMLSRPGGPFGRPDAERIEQGLARVAREAGPMPLAMRRPSRAVAPPL